MTGMSNGEADGEIARDDGVGMQFEQTLKLGIEIE